jgi:hypothetical protein
MAYVPIVLTPPASDEVKAEIKEHRVRLLEGIGGFNILNYEEGLREAMARAVATKAN